MAAVMSFPFYKAVSLAVRQCKHPSLGLKYEMLHHSCAEGVESLFCCSRWEERGEQPRARFSGPTWHPLEHSWTRNTDTAPSPPEVPAEVGFSHLSCGVHADFSCDFFCFQVSLVFPFLNTSEFSKWEIIFCSSRQICCYLSRLSDVAGEYNKCLLLLIEIKLLGANLTRGIKNQQRGEKKDKEQLGRGSVFINLFIDGVLGRRAGLCLCQQDSPAYCCASACPNFALAFWVSQGDNEQMCDWPESQRCAGLTASLRVIGKIQSTSFPGPVHVD